MQLVHCRQAQCSRSQCLIKSWAHCIAHNRPAPCLNRRRRHYPRQHTSIHQLTVPCAVRRNETGLNTRGGAIATTKTGPRDGGGRQGHHTAAARGALEWAARQGAGCCTISGGVAGGGRAGAEQNERSKAVLQGGVCKTAGGRGVGFPRLRNRLRLGAGRKRGGSARARRRWWYNSRRRCAVLLVCRRVVCSCSCCLRRCSAPAPRQLSAPAQRILPPSVLAGADVLGQGVQRGGLGGVVGGQHGLGLLNQLVRNLGGGEAGGESGGDEAEESEPDISAGVASGRAGVRLLAQQHCEQERIHSCSATPLLQPPPQQRRTSRERSRPTSEG